MRKIILYIATPLIFIISCKKDDDRPQNTPIVGNPPSILLLGKDTIQIGLYETNFPEPGYTAYDFEDGDLTSSVILDVSSINTSQIGFYSKRYIVKDSDNNGISKRRVYQVTNSQINDQPLITLLGSNPYQLEMRSAYVEPGYIATDQQDGDITSNVFTDLSNINVLLPGSYNAMYTVYDSDLNMDTKSRAVNVVATANALTGNYNVIDSCGSGSGLQIFTYSQSVAALNSTTIGFNLFADYAGNTGITATINPSGLIILPAQSALNIGSLFEDHQFQGSGSVFSNGFLINYTDTNLSTVPVSLIFCRAYFYR